MSSAGPQDPTPRGDEENTSRFEYLPEDQSARPADPAGRKRAAAGVAGLAVLALAGAGAYGVMQFMSTGDSAATAVPDHALGYLSLDLDPSGGQKVAAYETMRKFPALKEQLGLESDDDPRRWIVDAINSSGECSLDFENDVEPWLGNKMAFSGVEGEEEPEPFFVLEVTDTEAAEEGVATLFECGGESEEYGTAMVGDFMVVAQSVDVADGIAADAEESSLADDETFAARLDDAGDQGVVTGYLAPAAVQLMLDEAEDSASSSSAEPGVMPEGDLGMGVVPAMGPEIELLRDHLDEFDGAAMQVRFADAGVEMEMVAAGIEQADQFEAGDSGMADLPSTTAVAYGLALGPEAVEAMEDAVKGQMSDAEYESEIQMFEQETGLAFPEDVETLLGDGISFALDGSFDFKAIGEAFGTGQLQEVGVPAGLRIVTDDTDGVVAVTDKLQGLVPPGTPFSLEVEEGDGAVAVGVDSEYVAQLADDGNLGESEAFDNAVPDVEGSAGGLFVDFDAGGWLDELVGEHDPEALENTEPLSSMGVSGGSEGDTVRMLMRLTTD